MEEFQRIKRLPPYVFNIVNELKARERAAGADIIDFGMGNPYHPTPPHFVDKLVEAAWRETRPTANAKAGFQNRRPGPLLKGGDRKSKEYRERTNRV